ncbi:MAG TPA: metallophosphoesterase [Gemmatimonadaceae bacterium]|nr:metallophosphoesterase [Gemmatimonadaceae bacterium]
MRLVHLADLHLGFRQYHRLTPDGINQREADVALVFRRAIDKVIALRPDVVLIAGDVFHTVRPMNAAIIEAFTQLQRLKLELPRSAIVMVAGNHDRPRATETGCILDLFARIGVHVVTNGPRRIPLPAHDLSMFAVPDLPAGAPPLGREQLEPDLDARYNVLVMHADVEGMLPPNLVYPDRPSSPVPVSAIGPERWTYVALGHYHVHKKMAPNMYYCGSLEYLPPNMWSEMHEERATGVPGKGFIEYDLDAGTHRFHPIVGARRLAELAPIAARGLTAAEVDAAIRERVDSCEGGIDDRVARLVVRDVPRHVVRELDHKALREYKRRALHFHLDARKPDTVRLTLAPAGGRRATLREIVETYLSRRPLDADVDRASLVSLGLEYLDAADVASEQAWAAGASGPVPDGPR